MKILIIFFSILEIEKQKEKQDEITMEIKVCSSVCRTNYKNSAITMDVADFLYGYLMENRMVLGHVRVLRGKHVLFTELVPYISCCLGKLTKKKYAVLGLYVNYYEDGKMYTPNQGTLLSLGCDRVLVVGKKEYNMKNGDAIIFGSSVHGVPKSETKEGRISIATFMMEIR